ncbi:lantibiotic immunity ABC transporter MutE/EpiE family permease subunit [Aminipila terrae]|uniref:Lantibiotic immunity ABC transporter MutE/EpiE family permease subunit n=1 Tax=Aminipila terrae TaxID=2697030 RepID=A0A6P1MDZ9_9FIRM|nr:lantibiotic immunity ABC transporter MutE/EpiE family permease subunit [Aminipila terrae]QHI72252.1 lantibiotic immunity ABC transporter MutE/EpiE family permease subunit [Aminipila terrae]
MLNYIKSEFLKQKYTFNNKIIWVTSLAAIVISLLLMPSSYTQTFTYNCWYITFLPFTFAFISASIVRKDVKYNYHGLFGVATDKKQLWYAKIITGTLYLFFACIIFFIEMAICGIVFIEKISIANNLLASVLIFITFAWQVPFFMIVSQKTNLFVSVFLSMVCNIAISCVFAVKSCWWIPFSIPARLMCPVIHVMPNALPVEQNSIYENPDVILPGVIITVILFFAVSFITTKIFEKQEV